MKFSVVLLCYVLKSFLNISAEAANVNAGLGFNGFDENGNAKWDLLQNAKVRAVEVCNLECSPFIHQFTWSLKIYTVIKDNITISQCYFSLIFFRKGGGVYSSFRIE